MNAVFTSFFLLFDEGGVDLSIDQNLTFDVVVQNS